MQGVTVEDSGRGDVIEDLSERIIGRFSLDDIFHPDTGEIIIRKDELIDEEIAAQIVAAGIKKVAIRSALTCKSRYGVCIKCYGRNLATGKLVEVGEAVGIIAAQSIGEPGTQLTCTFHTGGVAGDDITQGLPRVEELFEARKPILIADHRSHCGDGRISQQAGNKITRPMEIKTYPVPYGAH